MWDGGRHWDTRDVLIILFNNPYFSTCVSDIKHVHIINKDSAKRIYQCVFLKYCWLCKLQTIKISSSSSSWMSGCNWRNVGLKTKRLKMNLLSVQTRISSALNNSNKRDIKEIFTLKSHYHCQCQHLVSEVHVQSNNFSFFSVIVALVDIYMLA